jgi:hypothetical protein
LALNNSRHTIDENPYAAATNRAGKHLLLSERENGGNGFGKILIPTV